MSQDDQRDQPREGATAQEPEASRTAQDAGAGAGVGSGATMAEPAAADTDTDRNTATAATATPTSATPGRHAAELRREFRDPGEGAPRYAATREQAPPSGSEESWSAAPNPGYQRDPAIDYPTKRLVAGALVGALFMAAFVAYGARILTNRSGNGNGSAPWTANFERDGAAIGGINAPNNGAAHAIPLPADVTFGNSGSANAVAISAAVASCRTATATRVPVSTATGTPATVGDWAVRATPSVQSLRTNGAGLQTALAGKDVAAVAHAATKLCSAYPTIAALPPMPDAAGSQAWSSAAAAFATAATESLRGASGNPDATAAALDNLTAGDKQLDALSARIMAVG